MNKEKNKVNSKMPLTLLEHLAELRVRLIRSIITVIIATIILFPFANELYVILSQPLMENLAKQGGVMIATQVASPFLTPFKLSILSGLFIAMPMLLYQLWGFIAPGLYKHEKKFAIPLLLLSVILFYSGILFAYTVVFPIMFSFLTGAAPDGVQVSTDISLYLDFSLKLFFAFGFAFQIPIITILLVVTDCVKSHNLSQKRPYVIVGSFVLGMLLTPPDVISQALLAIPIWLLFEGGLVVGGWLKTRRENKQTIA